MFFNPQDILASSAKSVVETHVESSGESQIYQSVETAVDGETVIKESSQAGKLELKMEKSADSEPTVSFSQEPVSSAAPSFATTKSFFQKAIRFFRKLLFNLTAKLR